MSFKQEIGRLLRAATAGIWVESHEADEVEAEIASLVAEANQQNSRSWDLICWDNFRGFYRFNREGDYSTRDALAALQPPHPSEASTKILLLHNYHRHLTMPIAIQALANRIRIGKRQRQITVITAPVTNLPPELEKLVTTISYQLPNQEKLAQIASQLANHDGKTYPIDQAAIKAASGLTVYEAEAAFTLSLVKHSRIDPESVWEQKAQMLKKTTLMSLYRPQTGFEKIGGLQALKAFSTAALTGRQRAHGILLLGVPGSGKSAFCKALGKETGRPTMTLDIGALYSRFMGETESNTRHTFKIADAMAPCILMIDEIEKGLSGLGSTGDSGVSSRVVGTMLNWLSDRTSDTFLVATSNDISKLPPEFSRAERFDAVFFVDLPSREEKDLIWEMYREEFAIEAGQRRPDDERWTGAEIKACCRLASMMGCTLKEAAEFIIPVSKTHRRRIDELREWADGNCLDASNPGVYRQDLNGMNIRPRRSWDGL